MGRVWLAQMVVVFDLLTLAHKYLHHPDDGNVIKNRTPGCPNGAGRSNSQYPVGIHESIRQTLQCRAMTSYGCPTFGDGLSPCCSLQLVTGTSINCSIKAMNFSIFALRRFELLVASKDVEE